MLDIKLITENPELVKERLAKKGCIVDFTEILRLDAERKRLMSEIEALKAERNKVSAEIPKYKKEGKSVDEIFARMRQIGDTISEGDAKINGYQQEITDFISRLPNMPDDDLLPGEKENNKVIKVFGEKPNFDFKPKNHVDLCTDLGIIDYERGVKLSGNGYWIYRGDGARLEWALLNYFVSTHLKDGYEMILPPHMLGYNCGYGAGQFPKFTDEVYWVDSEDGEKKKAKFMLPTAETALVNMYAGEIIDEDKLPMKFFAYTPCYRKEAGTYRAEERGMIRGHQFNKVEMVQYARTYDIEVWIPSMGIYKEVSSVSNANDYQARRNNTRFRDKETGKTRFVHTLNGSGLATSRVFPALIEQFQNADGSIRVPEVLVPFMGTDVIKK